MAIQIYQSMTFYRDAGGPRTAAKLAPVVVAGASHQ
jgi:hypothetical protein